MEQLLFSRIYHIDLSRFSNKSSYKLIEYLNKWQVELEDKGGLIKDKNHHSTITMATKDLKRLPLSRQLIQDRRLKINNQNEYIEFYKGYIINLTNRKANAIMEKITMKQKLGQKVQAMLWCVIKLKMDIPKMNVKQKRGQHFLNIL